MNEYFINSEFRIQRVELIFHFGENNYIVNMHQSQKMTTFWCCLVSYKYLHCRDFASATKCGDSVTICDPPRENLPPALPRLYSNYLKINFNAYITKFKISKIL